VGDEEVDLVVAGESEAAAKGVPAGGFRESGLTVWLPLK